MKYGLLTTTSMNIGDEIQCLAAFRFLPWVDYLIHRERIDEFDLCESPVKLIMNHWWLWSERHFPPSDRVDPLYVSFHLQYRLRNEKFLSKEIIEHFKKYEPIGCRDIGTAAFLNAHGIRAFFSGCLTSTLLPNPTLKNKFYSDYILCVDVPIEIVEEIRRRTSKEVLCIERHQKIGFSFEERLRMAKLTLFLYHNASCVVTIALHAALPATAFRTPVCVISQDGVDAKTRFEGLEKWFNTVTQEQFMKNLEGYDINNPPKNPETYLKYSQELVETCSKFTGYDCKQPTLEDDYNPVRDMAKILPYTAKSVFKAMYFATEKEMMKIYLKRKIRGDDRFGLEPSRACDAKDVLGRSQ